MLAHNSTMDKAFPEDGSILKYLERYTCLTQALCYSCFNLENPATG